MGDTTDSRDCTLRFYVSIPGVTKTVRKSSIRLLFSGHGKSLQERIGHSLLFLGSL